ncbi:hypothetical protein J2X65_004251 [Ancylobacter sp. 3268]|uniref:hypothetical protein n=1 Tax=Ancylobacter sp. 3268 TaxID=2817752 RepID=UPI0028675586|nr:hypothetical protein [Ancylobacter sp. 3268]MDR6954875.1 hypothetical protein [Ancylobacter sp. 3268]
MQATPEALDVMFEQVWADIVQRTPPLTLLSLDSNLRTMVRARVSEGLEFGLREPAQLRDFAVADIPSLRGERRPHAWG